MSTFVLIRHGSTDHIGKILSGRTKGVTLNSAGLRQIRELVHKIEGVPVSTVYTSPLERTVQTAAPIAGALGLSPIYASGLLELDFGLWTGKTFTELDTSPQWHAFNRARASYPAPEGESLEDVRNRVMAFLNAARQQHAGQIVAAVTHGDVIRTVVLAALGAPLDSIHHLEIDPASFTIIDYRNDAPRVIAVNIRGPLASRLHPALAE